MAHPSVQYDDTYKERYQCKNCGHFSVAHKNQRPGDARLFTCNNFELKDSSMADRFTEIYFRVFSGHCELCDEYALVLSCDSSGNEYEPKKICEKCILVLWEEHRSKMEQNNKG